MTIEESGQGELTLRSEDFLGGHLPDLDPLRIPDNSFADTLNAVYLRGFVIRRNGLAQYQNTKPDSNKIMSIYAAVQVSAGIMLIRCTASALHRATSSGWTAITASGVPAISGGSYDHFNFTFADERIFFTNNGVDPIREIDPATDTYIALGNAPQYRFITSAFNRIVGANRVDTTNDPTEVGWCGDLAYDEWDPLVDFSAGSTPLVDSPSDTNDEITGIFNLSNAIVIPRQRSIWLANKQPSSTQPFYFFPGLPRIGADIPRAIELTDYGLVWYNFQTSSLYVWTPGAADPEEVAAPIRRTLRESIDSPNNVWVSYSRELKSASIFVNSNSSSVTKCFTYNFIHTNWSYQEFYNVSEVADLDFSGSSHAIDDLSGTIDSLSGTTDSLGGLVATSNRFFGFNDGEIATDPSFSGLASEAVRINATDLSSTSYSTTLSSKIWEIPREAIVANLIRLEFTPYSTGSLTLQYRRNGGDWVTAKTLTVGDTFRSQILQIKKAIKCRTLQWRVTTDDCMFALHNSLIRINMNAGISDE